MPKVKVEKSYRTQLYKKEWESEQWAAGWLKMGKTASKGYCLWCDKEIVSGKSELLRHASSSNHVAFSKTVGSSTSLLTFMKPTGAAQAKIRSELNLVALIARKNISFNFLDSFMEMLHFSITDSKIVKDMTCNRTKCSYLLTECLAKKAHTDLVQSMKNSAGFSILCDKATDITMNKIFCTTVRFVDSSSSSVESKLYRLVTVEKGNAAGLFDALETCLREDGISWSKVIGYASDGENLMQGENNSVLSRMKEVVPDIFIMKCFCHSFHLVASHACEQLSKTAEQLVHDVYNYFKLSPNRQASYAEFQHFLDLEPHKILKPCQTRWLSLVQCVNRLNEQWPALELFFTAEVAENKSSQASNILSNLKAPYIKATLKFTGSVLLDIVGLNKIFQSEDFQLHRLLPEVQRVARMFCANFMKRNHVPSADKLQTVDVDDDTQWLPVEEVYPGLDAHEMTKQLKPHEIESFLNRCRNFYKEAVRQVLQRVDVGSPVLKALQDIDHVKILKGSAASASIGILFKNLRIMKEHSDNQGHRIDAQWRSLLIDEDVRKGTWEKKSIHDFWRAIKNVSAYSTLGAFALEILALPQSTAGVERAFSKINLNKTKLRNRLSVRATEAVVKVSENFKTNFEVDPSLITLYNNARSNYNLNYTTEERESYETESAACTAQPSV